jgi:hypothetical protein
MRDIVCVACRREWYGDTFSAHRGVAIAGRGEDIGQYLIGFPIADVRPTLGL